MVKGQPLAAMLAAFTVGVMSHFVVLPPISAIASTCAVEGIPDHLPCPSQAWETVDLEHDDRVQRLRRLAVNYSGFTFEEDIIEPEDHGLENFPASIPILRVIADQSLFFDSGSDVLRPEASTLIDIIAESLGREPPDVSLFVAGHTDSQGSYDYNLDLGMRRATEVSSELIRRGIYQADIYQVSFGEHMPIADNGSWSGRARNRRVEFLFAARAVALVPYLERQEIEFCPAGGTENRSTCDRVLSFGVERIFIEPEQTTVVIEIEQELQDLELDVGPSKGQTNVSVQRRVQELEFERNRVPVTFEQPRIFIEFGS